METFYWIKSGENSSYLRKDFNSCNCRDLYKEQILNGLIITLLKSNFSNPTFQPDDIEEL